MNLPPRPGHLTAGLVLTAIHAVLMFGLLTLAMAAMGVGGFAVASAGEPVFPLSILVSLGVAFCVAGVLFYCAVLCVCWKASEGSRPWLWALVVLACIGLVNTGPISVVINVLTIVGAVQWLDQIPKDGETVVVEG